MPESDAVLLLEHLRHEWRFQPDNPKVARYVGQFTDRQRIGQKITARVQGNYGVYTVTIQVLDGHLQSSCTCYIGASGHCHHCDALAQTFLDAPESFTEITPKTFDEVRTLADLPDYLNTISLDELIDRLKAAGITQKAFADAIGTTSRAITDLKADEERHFLRDELGALKIAALWVLETFGE